MKPNGYLVALAWSLAVLAAAGVVYGVRVSMAQVLYHQAKYGVAKNHVDGVLRRVDRIHRLYPMHYLACTLGAATARRESLRNPARKNEMERIAAHWCHISLVLNPYKRQMRLLRARLMSSTDPAGAVAYWDAYRNWSFWSPFNHLAMVELCVKAGDFSRAVDALAWTRGFPEYEKASRMMREAWAGEREPPAAIP